MARDWDGEGRRAVGFRDSSGGNTNARVRVPDRTWKIRKNLGESGFLLRVSLGRLPRVCWGSGELGFVDWEGPCWESPGDRSSTLCKGAEPSPLVNLEMTAGLDMKKNLMACLMSGEGRG